MQLQELTWASLWLSLKRDCDVFSLIVKAGQLFVPQPDTRLQFYYADMKELPTGTDLRSSPWQHFNYIDQLPMHCVWEWMILVIVAILLLQHLFLHFLRTPHQNSRPQSDDGDSLHYIRIKTAPSNVNHTHKLVKTISNPCQKCLSIYLRWWSRRTLNE